MELSAEIIRRQSWLTRASRFSRVTATISMPGLYSKYNKLQETVKIEAKSKKGSHSAGL